MTIDQEPALARHEQESFRMQVRQALWTDDNGTFDDFPGVIFDSEQSAGHPVAEALCEVDQVFAYPIPGEQVRIMTTSDADPDDHIRRVQLLRAMNVPSPNIRRPTFASRPIPGRVGMLETFTHLKSYFGGRFALFERAEVNMNSAGPDRIDYIFAVPPKT